MEKQYGPPEEPEKPEEGERKANISFQKTTQWQSGQYIYSQYTATVENIGNRQISSWQFELSEKDIIIDQIWNAQLTESMQIGNSPYNGIIEVSEKISFGFIIKTTKENIQLNAINIILN